MRIFTVSIFFVFSLILIINAKDYKLKKQPLNVKAHDVKVNVISFEEPTSHFNTDQKLSVNRTANIKYTINSVNREVGASGNGYGWLNSLTRGVDRYTGPDAENSGTIIDYLLIGHRGANAKDMAATEIDISAGLASGEVYQWDGASGLNNQIFDIYPGSQGARYPCVVALDRPFVAFNHYLAGDVENIPATSHPYLITDYVSYGPMGGGWTSPDFKMDEGWLNPTIEQFTEYKENRLWNGAVSVVKDVDGIYHYVGVYDTWFSDPEKADYNVVNDVHILNATSVDVHPAYGWTLGSDVGNDPVWLDTSKVWLPQYGVALNNSGFGAIAGPGHLGGSNELDYFYIGTKITYATTNDYGVSWSAWDTVSFADLGFPAYHDSTDSMLLYWEFEISGSDTDTVLVSYDGHTFMGTNFDMDIVVDENNTIYVAFNALWGRPGTDGWYPAYDYTGVWMAKKEQGQPWVCSQLSIPNGVFEGDEHEWDTFFNTEVSLSLDGAGTVYAAWLDRRHTDVQRSRFNRYADPKGTAPQYNTFKTDVFASSSIDGGITWSEKVNCTDTPGLDEYEFNLARHSKSGETGTIWFAYCIPDTVGANPNVDYYISGAQAVWAGEATGFPSLTSISDDNDAIVNTFVLNQNYPNPFNPTTAISYQFSAISDVELTVYNMLGQKVATLVNEKQSAGIHQVAFNGTGLASGVYYYRLSVGANTSVRKMVLMK